MVRKIDHRFSCVHVTSFPLISLTNRFFLCWEHSVPGMKTVELTPTPTPPPTFPYQFSRLPAAFIHSRLPTTQTFREIEKS